MAERQVLRLIRLYIAFALIISSGTITYLSWYSFPHEGPPAMLTAILLTAAALIMLPVFGLASFYIFPGIVGRWVFKNEPKYEDPRY